MGLLYLKIGLLLFLTHPLSIAYSIWHLAAFLVAALLAAATAAWHLLKGRRDALVKTSFSMALWLIFILAPLQVFIGDAHGLNTLKHQPAKLAAMEGHWETNHDHGMPLYLFGIPDMQDRTHEICDCNFTFRKL